jgi:7,8-dihydroneopterin aldolase/epimerase/oxygenase
LDSVFLRGLSFYGYHGVHPEETSLGQRFEVDLDASIDLQNAGSSDDLQHTVSYSDLYAVAQGVVEGEPRNLIDTVASEIARRALSRFPLIESITVEIRKPSAPVRAGGLDHVGVRVHRTRDDL